jgi:hypothetical protein
MFDNYMPGEKELVLAKMLEGTCERNPNSAKIAFASNIELNTSNT